MAELDDYAWLTSDDAAPWLERVSLDARPELQLLAALRRDLPTERARMLVEQVDLRRRAAEKFGNLAAGMYFTRQQLEQATDIWTARYKAQKAFNDGYIADYCCGIGGDLIAFAERGPAAGWDVSPVVCLLAATNLGKRAPITCADVATVTPERRGAWHFDPDRRASGRRVTDLEAYGSAPDLAMEWLHANSNGFVKFAPATDLPESWSTDAEREWITFNRECRQQVAWLAPEADSAGRRRATLVRREGEPSSFVGDGDVICETTETPGRYLFDPDPSLLAANLLGAFAAEHGLATLGVGSAYLTGDASISHPLASRFKVIDCLPLRAVAVANYLAVRNVGVVEIKKRGVAISPEPFRQKLRLRGDNAATLVLTRIGKREVAMVVERCD